MHASRRMIMHAGASRQSLLTYLWMRSQIALKEESQRVTLNAECGLHANPDIAQLHPGNQQIACTPCSW